MPIVIEHGNPLIDGLARAAPGVEEGFDKYRKLTIQNQELQQQNELHQQTLRSLVQSLADKKAEARMREEKHQWEGQDHQWKADEHDYQRQQRIDKEKQRQADLEGDRALFRYQTGHSLDGTSASELPQDLKDYMAAVDEVIPKMDPAAAHALLTDTHQVMTDRLKQSNVALATSQIKRMAEPNPTGAEPALDKQTAENLQTLIKLGHPVDDVFKMMFNHLDAVGKGRATDGDLVAASTRMDTLLQAADGGQLANVDPQNVQEARAIHESLKGARLSGTALIQRERDFTRTLFGPPAGGSRGSGKKSFSEMQPEDRAFEVWQKLPDLERTPQKLDELNAKFSSAKQGGQHPAGAAQSGAGAKGAAFQSVDPKVQADITSKLKSASSGEEFDKIMKDSGIDPDTLPESVFHNILDSRAPQVQARKDGEDAWAPYGTSDKEQLQNLNKELADPKLKDEARQVVQDRVDVLEKRIEANKPKPQSEEDKAKNARRTLPALDRSKRNPNNISPEDMGAYLRNRKG